jgi:hypothetical protein
MDTTPKRGRPPRIQKMVKFSVFVTERDYWDLKARAREEDRPVTFITTRAISRDVDEWRRMRAASLFPAPAAAAPDAPAILVDPTETAIELMQAAVEREAKRGQS